MNREEVIDLWSKANGWSVKEFNVTITELERFATLVAAAERESWPAEMEAMESQVNILTDALAKAKAEEREVCAKVCDEAAHDWHQHAKGGPVAVYNACAAAIRARGNT